MSAKYDRIGIDYNDTRRADPYLASRLLHHLDAKAGDTCLDIGCGTGNYTLKMRESGIRFIGVDPSKEMLGMARSRGPNLDWREGSAEEIPLKDASADGVVASFTLHHWKDLGQAFRELKRVMRPEARVVILTSTPEQMRGYWLCDYFPQMLADSIQQMPTYELVAKTMAGAGLQVEMTEKYFIHEALEDWFLYSGKHDPGRYLDPRVRKGISSFADLALHHEVQMGLDRLKMDLDSGDVREVMARYENDLGDYLFIVGRKPAPPAP